ncbi:MAG: histidine phosphatase family protein [Prolixibacteraceae bacterium]|nr:histidine phosphatase family protein [Prolixibacteraceae bacterium]
MIYLTIIRHGETIQNLHKLVQGQQPGKLSPKGLKQVEKLAERLKDETTDVFYSSDLYRALETSKAILSFHPEWNIIKEPLLRERFMSSWEGKPFPRNWNWSYLPEGAETTKDMIDRAKTVVSKIQMNDEGKKVMVVTHGSFIKAILTVLFNKPESDFFSWEEPKNTGVSRFELYPDGKVKIIEKNNIDHLDAETQPVDCMPK